MLPFQPVDPVALAANVSGVNGVREHIGHALLRDDAFVVAWKLRQAFKEALNLSLGLEAARGVTLKGFPYHVRKRLMRHEDFAASFDGFIAIANRRIVNPVTVFHAGAHLLGNLSPVLFTLQCALRCHNGFNKFAFGGLIKLEVQAFNLCIPQAEGFSQIQMKARVTGKAFEIIKYDHKAFTRLRVEEAEQRDHTGALHKVPAPCNRIGEDRSNFIALGSSMLTATGFLGFQAVPFILLRAG